MLPPNPKRDVAGRPGPPLAVQPEVAAALADGGPVVALETAVVSHGLPWPDNLETARHLEQVVRGCGAVPATVGLAAGRVHIGLDPDQLQRFAESHAVAKVSRRDFGPVLAGGGLGATTVAGSLICARSAGIRLLATGGIGGVHRGGQDSLDISADLTELSRSPVATVCAGAKGILDLARTLEVLETLGVPVVGYTSPRFPAFWCRDSGLALEHQVDSPRAAAAVLRHHWALGLRSGLVLAVPPPAAAALAPEDIEQPLHQALAEAERRGIAGKALTPFLLGWLNERSAGACLAANRALLERNARLAAEVAVALAAEALAVEARDAATDGSSDRPP